MVRDRATLTVLAGPMPGSILTLEAGQAMILGRGEEATARIDDQGLSRQHARIFPRRDAFYIEDLGSKNGTFVDGEAIHTPVVLHDGNRIQIGQQVLLR
ncbi:MAG: FHA domain-containing protein, partial [Polyangiales bacterium]